MTDAIDLLFTETRTVAALGTAAAAGLAIGWFVAPVIGIFAFSIGFFAISGISIARCVPAREAAPALSARPARI